MLSETASSPQERTTANTHCVVAEVLSGLEGCRRVLDIPCGEGAFVARIANAGLEVHAADCRDLVEVAGAVFHRADMNQRLPYADDQFDAVISIDGIEHLENPFGFVRECARILRPGGSLIVSTPNVSSLRSRWRWFLTGFHNKCKSPLNESAPSPSHHVGMISFPRLRYMLHTNGFQITAVRSNRIKPVSWAYAPWIPLAYAVTARVFAREERDPGQRGRNREILRQMFSLPVLLGETMIVAARCEKPGG
jgi:2-polyprenyl-3-methyl-5-hydroxy-6-metoxy-1,4-benzoquinol methylase